MIIERGVLVVESFGAKQVDHFAATYRCSDSPI